MLFHATRPTVSEEESTSATYVAQLHKNKKHTFNAETQQNAESTDQNYLKTGKISRSVNTTQIQIYPPMLLEYSTLPDRRPVRKTTQALP